MHEIIYTDAPPEIGCEIDEGRILDISIDDLIKQNRKEREIIMNILGKGVV